MFNLSLVLSFSQRICPEIYYYYYYFIRQYTLEGAYFFYKNTIVFVDVLPGGINYLKDPENRFSLDIIDHVSLYFYPKEYRLIYKYYKQENITQIYKNQIAYAVPLNWFSPDQTTTIWAADKKTQDNLYVRIFSTGYKVTSLVSNIQDTNILVVGETIKFKGVPLKTKANNQPSLFGGNTYQIEYPDNIEGIIIFPLNLQLTSQITVEPYIGQYGYPEPNTFVLNENNLLKKASNSNIILNNNVTRAIDGKIILKDLDIDVVYESIRALIGLRTLYYRKNQAYSRYYISDLPYGFYDLTTRKIIPSDVYKTLTIVLPTTPGALNGFVQTIPDCLEYDSSFTFIYYKLLNQQVVPLSYYKTMTDGTHTWNYFTINIDLTRCRINDFLLYSPLLHSCTAFTNGTTTKFPINSLQSTAYVQPAYYNKSGYVIGNKKIMNYNFINNHFTYSSNETLDININRPKDNNVLEWINTSNLNIQAALNKISTVAQTVEISEINNCIFMDPSGIIAFYYLNFEQIITTTIRTNVTLTDKGDGYLYSPQIYISPTILTPEVLGFNMQSNDPNFANSNVIECNTQIRRQIVWYPWTFIRPDKSYFTFKKMDKNPFQIRILKNDILDFNVDLQIYV